MICLENIIKRYRNDIILNRLNLSLDRNQMTALAGISGCGKTSLMKIAAGIDTAYNGNYLLNNESLSIMNDKGRSEIRAKHIGYIPQDIYLMEKNTVKDNILLSLLYYPDKNRIKELLSDMENLLEKLNLLEKANKKVVSLSSGEKKRVMVARALIKKPDIIIADEPTSGLDKNNCTNVLELFKEFKQKDALIFIATHDEFVVESCDRVLNMSYGTLIE